MQRGQAPCGELKEKIRGSSSGMEVPHFRHENFSEKTSVPADSRTPRAPVECFFAGFSSDDAFFSSRSSTSTKPSASATAVSTESASRLRTSGFIWSRSTTTAMSCLYFLSRSIGSSSRRSSPSTCARVKPSSRSSSNRSLYSPLRPRTTGAITMKRVPSSSVIRWSTICSIDWPAIGSPQLWQWGWPIRAQSRRR